MEVVSNTVGSYFGRNSLFLYLWRIEVFPVRARVERLTFRPLVHMDDLLGLSPHLSVARAVAIRTVLAHFGRHLERGRAQVLELAPIRRTLLGLIDAPLEPLPRRRALSIGGLLRCSLLVYVIHAELRNGFEGSWWREHGHVLVRVRRGGLYHHHGDVARRERCCVPR